MSQDLSWSSNKTEFSHVVLTTISPTPDRPCHNNPLEILGPLGGKTKQIIRLWWCKKDRRRGQEIKSFWPSPTLSSFKGKNGMKETRRGERRRRRKKEQTSKTHCGAEKDGVRSEVVKHCTFFKPPPPPTQETDSRGVGQGEESAVGRSRVIARYVSSARWGCFQLKLGPATRFMVNQTQSSHVGYEALQEVTAATAVLWGVTPCRLVDTYSFTRRAISFVINTTNVMLERTQFLLTENTLFRHQFQLLISV
jgi:hypothetical protein